MCRLALLLIPVLALAADPNKEEWLKLFNGKNLKGWTPKIRGYVAGDNFGKTFRVENGVMKVAYDAYDPFNERFGHIFYKDKFSYYVIQLEYRFTGEQAKGGPAWALRNKLFTPHCLNSTSKTYAGDQWVKAEVRVLGSERVEHRINGELVLSYEKPQLGGGNVTDAAPEFKEAGKLLEEGSISLQSESHPVEFRNVQLLNLKGCMDPKAKNFKSYYVKADNTLCKF